MDSAKIAEDFYKYNEDDKKYSCNFCEKKFAKNVTRMSKHTSQCKSTPFQVHDLAVTVVTNIETKKRRRVLCTLNDENSENNTSTSDVDLSRRDSGSLLKVDDISSNISEAEKNHLWKLYFRAMASTNTPLLCNENKEWIDLFKCWKSSCPLPPQETLTAGLMEEEFKSIKLVVEKKIASCFSYGLQIERNERETLIFVSLPETYLYQIFSTEINFPGEILFEKVKSCLSELGREKCLTIVTNGDLKSSQFWRLLKNYVQNKRLSLALYPSALETLNSLLKEILQSLAYSNCKRNVDKIFDVVESNDKIKTEFVNASKNILQDETYPEHPFYTDENTKDLLNCLKKILQYLTVTYENFFVNSDVINLILDSGFWQESMSLFMLIEPIKNGIKFIRNNNVTLSQVKPIEKEISDQVLQNISKVAISEGEKIFVQNIISKRQHKFITPAHFAANILDPIYQGIDNSAEQYTDGIDYILKIGANLKVGTNEDILKNLSEYKLHEGQWKHSFMWETNLENPRTWWSSTCPSAVISKLACAISSLPPVLQFKRKNPKLVDESMVQKMRFIAFNINAL